MGDPIKRRKTYQTPRKKWDKQLLETEGKLVSFYGLKNKKELRKAEAWSKRKRTIAKDLMVLPMESRVQRQQELMGGLRKYGLVREDATIDDVLGLKIEEILEKRLQTQVMRKGLSNSSKQARQFIVHGHIAINGKKIDAPGYLVPMEEVSSIGWFRKPIKIENEKPKKDTKKEFEESMGENAEVKEASPTEEKKEEPKTKEAKTSTKEENAEEKKAETKEGKETKGEQ